MHNEVAGYLWKYKNSIDDLYQWSFDETDPHTKFGFKFACSTKFQKTLELKRHVSKAARNTTSEEEKVRLAKYFIKSWGGIKNISDKSIQEFVLRFNPIAFSERPSNSDFSFNKISSWSKWLSVICPKWACIYDTRVAFSLNVINYISGARYKIFPMPRGRNKKINKMDIQELLLNKKLSSTDSTGLNTIKETHFINNSLAYKSYIALIFKVHPLLWSVLEPYQYTEMLLFSLAGKQIYQDLFALVAQARK